MGGREGEGRAKNRREALGWVASVLQMSTKHFPPGFIQTSAGPCLVGGDGDAMVLSVPPMDPEGCPAELAAALSFARASRCILIRVSPDGPLIPSFRRFP